MVFRSYPHLAVKADMLAARHANAMLTSGLAMIKNVMCMTALSLFFCPGQSWICWDHTGAEAGDSHAQECHAPLKEIISAAKLLFFTKQSTSLAHFFFFFFFGESP